MPSRVRRYVDDLGILGLPGDVSPWDIRFDPHDAKHLDLGPDLTARFNVWTEPRLAEGFLVIRRSIGDIESHPMRPWSRGGRFDLWAVEVEPGDGFHYSFAFRTASGSPVYRVPSGITNAVERNDRWRLEPAGVRRVVVPEWAKGAVIYQVFPDRFAKGDPTLDPPGVVPWGSEPTSRQFQGGDLVGVRRRLGYLADLGVDALYLNPIFASPSNHRYDAVDYHTVDPMLGGTAELDRLIEAAHATGMRVVLDVSFNHVHPRFFAFADIVEHGADSPYRDWFVVHDWPVRLRYRPGGAMVGAWVKEWIPVWQRELGIPVETVSGPGRVLEPTYDAWYSVPTMPRLNLANPEAREHVLDVAVRWVRDHGIDGWRMDVARYVDADFWLDIRSRVKAVAPDTYLLAEIMGDAGPWLQGDRFDATMNYTFRSIALGFFATGELDGPALVDHLSRLVAQYAWPVTLVNHNLLDSHDTPRFVTEARGETWRALLATVLQLTFPGAPGIYYGNEVGLEGGDDPGSRAAFPWDDPASHPIHTTIRDLTRIRHRRRSLREGRFEPVTATPNLVVFERCAGRERTTVAINRGRRSATFEPTRRLMVRWGGAVIRDGVVTVDPWSAALLW